MPPAPIIYLDPRAGSGELAPYFSSHRTHPTVSSATLHAADIAFSGHGPAPDLPAMVGIERKTLRDMLSSIRTGRFSGEQLPKLLAMYDFTYLVVEGIYRTSDEGLIEEKRGGQWSPVHLGAQRTPFHALELSGFLNTISTHTPIIVHHTTGPRDTVDYAMGLHHYFEKPWDKHSAHLAIHIPAPPTVQFSKVGTVRRVAYVLEGVGWEKSGVVAANFPSVRAMVEADVKSWKKLPGFGKVLSEKIVRELNGDH